MSKQYLTTASLEHVHPTDIFSLACTPNQIISASGSSSLQIHNTTSSDFPHAQTLEAAHKLGCHHVAASRDGRRIVSVGFGGDVKIWSPSSDSSESQPPTWVEEGRITDGSKAGELWAVALSADGQYLASTTYDGRINVWDLAADNWPKIREYETKGSFGLCIDMSPDSAHTATGHASGAIYIFANATGRLAHSLPSQHAPVRTVRFSPHGSLLAAAGDSRSVALFDARSGDQVAALTGHASWIFSLDWSPGTGEWLASGGWDGVVRVWSAERRECVSVLRDAGGGVGGDVGRCVWSIRFLPRLNASAAAAGGGAGEGRRGEGFAAAGAGKGIVFYREAAGA